MQDRTEKSGAQLPLFVPGSYFQQHLLRKSTTYQAKIIVLFQTAPGKMFTVSQLTNTLTRFIPENRKKVCNNVTVCLFTNKCFVKVPVEQYSLGIWKNYWKLDSSQITAKMARRHFKGILQFFPELASKVETENVHRPSERPSALCSPEPEPCRAVQISCEVKFSSPFSIESLLKRDSPPAQASRASPLYSVPIREEQQSRPTHRSVGTKRSLSWDSEGHLLLQASSGRSHICSTGGSTHRGLTAAGAAKPIKSVSSEASLPVHRRAGAAPYFTSPHSSYIMCSVPAFTHDALHFCL